MSLVEDLSIVFKLGSSRELLKCLNSDSCSLQQSILNSITDCPRLEILTLSQNSFTNLTKDFRLGSSRHTLRFLDL